ncbi:MAG: hypothetical protein CMM58_10560 [Rhodospirillaceae bacterium]|nr:hypothetical protein [Rhodospirillaceae bacterium]|tara:strand:- start:1720 stop:2607 length:888 start_codon:yes stop_codon:yes gene_type:complete
MRLGLLSSSTLHLLVIAIAWFGLPHIRRDPPKLDPLIFVKIADIGDVTNVPNEPSIPEKTKRKKLKNPAPKTVKHKLNKLNNAEITKTKRKTPPKPEIKPLKQRTQKKQPKMSKPSKPKPRPIPSAVSPKKKLQKTPKPAKRPVEKQFTSLLKNLKKEKKQSRNVEKEKTLGDRVRKAAVNRSNMPYNPNQKVTVNEIEAVRQQISQCWNIAAGARKADALSVEIEMKMNPDATVRTARVVDSKRMNSDPFFRAAAESALRALSQRDCIPLKLPRGKYELWKSFTFNFDPKNMLQ